jgi:FkbH-like protein
MTELSWLPIASDWSERLKMLIGESANVAWPALVQLAQTRLDFIRTERLARAVSRLCGSEPPPRLAAPPVRLALLGSSTVEHLIPGIRVGGTRRNLWIDIYTGPYGQYLQDLSDPSSEIHRFRPTAVLFALDARHLIQSATAAATFEEADGQLSITIERLRGAWRLARNLGAQVLQQTALPVFSGLMGSNEHRLPWSPRRLVDALNSKMRDTADQEGVDIVSADEAIEHGGVAAWYDPGAWHRGKQEILPSAAPFYGDLVARVLAARLGRSSKCLVLDLDNTLWGGVIGDDGLEGIVLGQGNAIGEAHIALQSYAKDLSRRGVILAVCSKNDMANAIAPFDQHADMILRRSDIACFVANWEDKPSNLREIAIRLNIGLDALTFVDDNPFERNIVRRELPMVNVPELPEDPTGYVNCIADAGYFEAATITTDDLERTRQYQANLQREQTKTSTDIKGYLESLSMELRWKPFDKVGLQRIVQLINKSNQFNLTTHRYTVAETEALIGSPDELTLQLRLVDSVGDNGMISVLIGRPDNAGGIELDTWLMSCRVLGRQVEQASLNLLVERSLAAGFRHLTGTYIPTSKNQMVAEHYHKLGFTHEGDGGNGSTFWRLELEGYTPYETAIKIIQELP